jgi:hypothetical protein
VTDDQLTGEQQGAVGALKASRGEHPPADALLEYEALAPADRERHPAHDHLVVCSRCQLVVLHAAEPAPTQRTSVLRWALPLAAVAVLAVGLTLVSQRPVSNGPQEQETIRGTAIQLTAPLGAVEIVREFSWQSPIRVDRYRVIVRRGDTVVWQSETSGLTLAPPTGVFVRDVEYAWQVEAVDREGVVRMTSPSQSFVVY